MVAEIPWIQAARSAPWDRAIHLLKLGGVDVVGLVVSLDEQIRIDDQRSIYLVLGLSVFGEVELQQGLPTEFTVN